MSGSRASFSAVTISDHAASCLAGDPGARAPRTRYGCVTSAVMPPHASAASLTASTSGVSGVPPDPWVSTARKAGRRDGVSIVTRAGPALVMISMVCTVPLAGGR